MNYVGRIYFSNMSRARNWLKKVKKTDKLGKSLALKCRYCGMPIGKEIYDMDKPWEYTCKICGKQPYIELKALIDKNRNFKFDEVKNNA